MPITKSILDHGLIGPAIKQGRHAGVLSVVRRQLEKRFGTLPPSLEERLSAMPTEELEDLSVRILDAHDLTEFLN